VKEAQAEAKDPVPRFSVTEMKFYASNSLMPPHSRTWMPTPPTPIRRPPRRRLLPAFLIVLVVGVAWALPYGPLFPWSPWKPGYQRLHLERADVYWAVGTTLPSGLDRVDREIAASEAFHRLPVRSRITVVLCRNWSDFDRFLPNYRGARIGGATLVTGTVVYLTPRIAERGFDHGEFLRHELSHATLHQHQSLWDAFRTSAAEPFFEGLAVSFGRQRAFAGAGSVLEFADDHELGALLLPGSSPADASRDMRLNYQVWRYFLEYWIEARGRDAFQQLLKETMDDPDDYVEVFRRVYGASLEAAAAEFTTALRARRWVPRS
jgi:hypothetical protein